MSDHAVSNIVVALESDLKNRIFLFKQHCENIRFLRYQRFEVGISLFGILVSDKHFIFHFSILQRGLKRLTRHFKTFHSQILERKSYGNG